MILQISEGRSHYRELIERLQSARATQDDLKESRIREIMNALEGKTIAKMLIFLNEVGYDERINWYFMVKV